MATRTIAEAAALPASADPLAGTEEFPASPPTRTATAGQISAYTRGYLHTNGLDKLLLQEYDPSDVALGTFGEVRLIWNVGGNVSFLRLISSTAQVTDITT